MRRVVDAATRPRHSSLGLIFILATTLFATYIVLVPGIVKKYELQLEYERTKLNIILTRIELRQEKQDDTARMIREIHQKVCPTTK